MMRLAALSGKCLLKDVFSFDRLIQSWQWDTVTFFHFAQYSQSKWHLIWHDILWDWDVWPVVPNFLWKVELDEDGYVVSIVVVLSARTEKRGLCTKDVDVWFLLIEAKQSLDPDRIYKAFKLEGFVGMVDQIDLIQLNPLSNKDNQRLETIAKFGSCGGTATQSFNLCTAHGPEQLQKWTWHWKGWFCRAFSLLSAKKLGMNM